MTGLLLQHSYYLEAYKRLFYLIGSTDKFCDKQEQVLKGL